MKYINSENIKNEKYIIPKNYDFKPKLFGLLEYKFGVFLLILSYLLILIFQYINIPVERKIEVFLVITVPIFLTGTIGMNGESFFDFLFLLFSYWQKNKIFFYFKR